MLKSRTLLWVMFSFLGFLTPTKTSAQDWPNLEKYKKANANLSAPERGENRVVFMGNSITEMWQDAHPEFFSENPQVSLSNCNTLFIKELQQKQGHGSISFDKVPVFSN